MAFSPLTKDFAKQTLENFEQNKADTGQLINSIIGLLLFPSQKDFEKNKDSSTITLA